MHIAVLCDQFFFYFEKRKRNREEECKAFYAIIFMTMIQNIRLHSWMFDFHFYFKILAKMYLKDTIVSRY